MTRRLERQGKCSPAYSESSVQAVLEELEAEAISAELNALELLDGNTDAKALHGASFGPRYASNSYRVTIGSMWVGYECHQQSSEYRQKFAGIEVVSVCRFKKNGGGDVEQDSH